MERIVWGKAHSEAVRRIERKAGEAYRSGMEGSEERAREAARTNGRSAHYDPFYQLVHAQSQGVGGADGAGTGDRRRAGLREDEAGPWRGQANR